MTPEDRIAQLEAALALSQAKVAELATALAHAVEQSAAASASDARRREQEEHARNMRRERNRRHRDAKKTIHETSVRRAGDVSETSQPPSPPLDGSPLSSKPSLPSPLSSPQSLISSSPNASASAGGGQGDLLPDVPPTLPAKPKRARKSHIEYSDPRHYPLKLALVAAGWPFDGGKDAANLTAILALSDQQEATAGENAHAEVLRRAKIAWNLPGYDRARSLTELRLKWARAADIGTPTRQQDIWHALQESRRKEIEAAGLPFSPEMASADYINTALARWKDTKTGDDATTALVAAWEHYCADTRFVEKGLPVKLFLSPGVLAECEAKDRSNLALIADLQAPGHR